ncbi:cytochrome c [Oceaniradius stylonematis]|nr:cytochrome c [Oceaniradius stylonematis]
MRRLTVWMVLIATAGVAAFWLLSAPVRLAATDLAVFEAHEPDLANGENLFWAGGCASCHAAPDAEGDARSILSGGLALESPYGVFGVPGISPDPDTGIGGWSFYDFANAMKRGVAPDGRHYYPSFPYASYAKMPLTDLADLWAYLKTLPVPDSAAEIPQTQLSFPFNMRRGIGLWKRVYLDEGPVVADDALGDDPVLTRGRYLVEGPGHCGECHTPRNIGLAMDGSRWLAGAPNPEGEGRVPNITGHADGLAGWTADDIAYGLESGFTPAFDSMGGSMASVVKNLANAAAEDRAAIAAYLKAIPEIPDG